MERRFIASEPLKIEAREGSTPSIVGFAAVYHNPADSRTEFELFPGVRERIMPGAFDRAIKEDDVRALYNHEPNNLLGRTTAGTLKLDSQEKGLHYSITPPDTQLARDVRELVGRGDLTGSSFAFQVTDQEWITEDGVDIRQIKGVRLYDVGPVTFPAYEASTTGLRAAGDVTEARSAYDAWKKTQLDEAEATASVLKVKLAETQQRIKNLAAYRARAAELLDV